MQWLAFGDGCLRCWSQRKSSVDDDDRIRIRIRIRSDQIVVVDFPFLFLSPLSFFFFLPPPSICIFPPFGWPPDRHPQLFPNAMRCVSRCCCDSGWQSDIASEDESQPLVLSFIHGRSAGLFLGGMVDDRREREKGMIDGRWLIYCLVS